MMRAVGDRPEGVSPPGADRAALEGWIENQRGALQESDLDRGRGAVLVRRGKGGKPPAGELQGIRFLRS